jgi:hypothetical protein
MRARTILLGVLLLLPLVGAGQSNCIEGGTYQSGSSVFYCTGTGTSVEMAKLSDAGGGGVPVGMIALVVSGTCATGWSEVTALNGKMLRGTLAANADVGTTGGADSMTPTVASLTAGAQTFTGAAWSAPAIAWPGGVPTHAGTAISDHASHTHTYTDVIAHTHVITSQTATTGSATSYEHGTLDTSSAEAEATEVTGSTGIATGTTAGPSATLTHTVSNQGTVAWPAGVPTIGAYTPSGINGTSAVTGTLSAFNNRPAYTNVIFCSKD